MTVKSCLPHPEELSALKMAALLRFERLGAPNSLGRKTSLSNRRSNAGNCIGNLPARSHRNRNAIQFVKWFGHP